MKRMKVSDVMTHLVVTFRSDDSLDEASRRMLLNRISGAPVTEGGRLIGIVSEADLVRGANATTVGELMTRDVISVSPSASIWTAAALMDRHSVRRLPVVDEEEFVMGIVARADLVRALAAQAVPA